MNDLDLTKSLLDIPAATTTHDSFLGVLVEAAWGWAENYTGRTLQESTVTDTWLGDGSVSVLLREYPVTQIASVVVDAETLDGYEQINSVIRLTDQVYTRNTKCAITYVAGYDSDAIPTALQMAVCKLAAHWFSTRKQSNMTSANLAGESIGYHEDRIPWSVKDTLNIYKRCA